MQKVYREPGVSLLQQNPARDAMLQKMRSKLATTPSQAVVVETQKREVRRSSTATWTVRGIALLGLVAVNYFILGNREAIAAKIRKPAVPVLEAPSEAMTPDDQAMYYALALYDWPRFQHDFNVEGFVAVDANDAKRKLQELLPV